MPSGDEISDGEHSMFKGQSSGSSSSGSSGGDHYGQGDDSDIHCSDVLEVHGRESDSDSLYCSNSLKVGAKESGYDSLASSNLDVEAEESDDDSLDGSKLLRTKAKEPDKDSLASSDLDVEAEESDDDSLYGSKLSRFKAREPGEDSLASSIDVEAEESDDDSLYGSKFSRAKAKEPDVDSLDGSHFLDVEAKESDDDSLSDAEPGDESGRRSFTQFMLLPLELRNRVWELFCPDLVTKARFLQFDLAPVSAAAMLRSCQPNTWTVKDTYPLADQIESLRRLMATHRESREMGSRAFPNTLAIDAGDGKCDGIVRFSKHRDIVFLGGVEHLRHGHLCHVPGFTKHIVNVVVRSWASPTDQCASARIREALRLFPNMQRIYIQHYHYELLKKDLRWTVSDCVHQYLTETFEEEYGLGEDTQSVTCWPDVHGHPDFARFQIPPIHVHGRPAEIDRLVQNRGIHFWPLVTFELGRGMMRYRKILQLKDMAYHEDSDGSSDETGTSTLDSFFGSLDEYEGAGIDDDELMQYNDSSHDEGDDEIVHYDDSSNDDLTVDQLSDGSPLGGRFSSPELDIDGEASGLPEADMPRRPPKRRIVTDSDDDDSSAPDEPRAKRPRISRPTAADSDDDDSSAPDEPRAKRPRMSRPTAADSDDESDSAPEQNRRKRSLGTSDSESGPNPGGVQVHPEDDAASSSDDWDADLPQTRMSLAERLQAHGDAHVIPPSDDEGSSADMDQDEDDEDDKSVDEDGGGLSDY